MDLERDGFSSAARPSVNERIRSACAGCLNLGPDLLHGWARAEQRSDGIAAGLTSAELTDCAMEFINRRFARNLFRQFLRSEVHDRKQYQHRGLTRFLRVM